MRITDWSSDVCSSDLRPSGRPGAGFCKSPGRSITACLCRPGTIRGGLLTAGEPWMTVTPEQAAEIAALRSQTQPTRRATVPALEDILRSEEHTSELQSLMPIPHAASCLKKKN